MQEALVFHGAKCFSPPSCYWSNASKALLGLNSCGTLFFFFFFFCGAGDWTPRAFHTLGKHSTTYLHLLLQLWHSWFHPKPNQNPKLPQVLNCASFPTHLHFYGSFRKSLQLSCLCWQLNHWTMQLKLLPFNGSVSQCSAHSILHLKLLTSPFPIYKCFAH